jgi:hypothetical protein
VLQQAEQAVVKEAAAAAVRGELHEAAMALLGSVAHNATNIVVQDHRRTATVTREVAAAATKAAAVDIAATKNKRSILTISTNANKVVNLNIRFGSSHFALRVSMLPAACIGSIAAPAHQGVLDMKRRTFTI